MAHEQDRPDLFNNTAFKLFLGLLAGLCALQCFKELLSASLTPSSETTLPTTSNSLDFDNPWAFPTLNALKDSKIFAATPLSWAPSLTDIETTMANTLVNIEALIKANQSLSDEDPTVQKINRWHREKAQLTLLMGLLTPLPTSAAPQKTGQWPGQFFVIDNANPNGSQMTVTHGRIQAALGAIAVRDGDYSKASMHFENAQQDKHFDFDATHVYFSSMALMGEKKYDEALSELNRFLSDSACRSEPSPQDMTQRLQSFADYCQDRVSHALVPEIL